MPRRRSDSGATLPRVARRRTTPDAQTQRVRERVRLLVQITARKGGFRNGLLTAAAHLTPSEAAMLADLERHGLDVTRLRDVLCGAHVLVDDPALYEAWQFSKSRKRLSSHHKSIDKARYPDFGLKGPVVREKLHGRTASGTWVQFEKTPASMGDGFRLPDWHDVQHLVDYVVYRITKRNVGPWGLSAATERRPMYLSPDLRARVPLPPSASADLTAALEGIEDDDDTTAASADLARYFPPPDRVNTLAELVFVGGDQQSNGLFGASDVWVTEVPSVQARRLLVEQQQPPRWSLPDPGSTRAGSLVVGRRTVSYAVRVLTPGARAPLAPVPGAATATLAAVGDGADIAGDIAASVAPAAPRGTPT